MDNQTVEQALRERLADIRAVVHSCADDVVLIGGMAVSLHALEAMAALAETTHDADFFLSYVGYGILRDQHEITSNPRLGKRQLIYNRIDYDIYLEKEHDLAVAYEDAVDRSVVIEGLRCASLQDLLILKIDAFAQRGGSAKGDKDARDLARIVLLSSDPATLDADALAVALDPARSEVIASILRRTDLFNDLAGGNAHQAAKLRTRALSNWDQIRRCLDERPRNNGNPAPAPTGA